MIKMIKKKKKGKNPAVGLTVKMIQTSYFCISAGNSSNSTMPLKADFEILAVNVLLVFVLQTVLYKSDSTEDLSGPVLSHFFCLSNYT